jgi:hypothetical protein
MLRTLRLLPVLLAAVTGAVFAQTALTPEQAAEAAKWQAELDALRSGGWITATTLRTSVGWRDNVLLSPFAPLGRAFGRGEVETMLVRPQHGPWEFVSFLNGEVVRYFSPPAETGGEQQWVLHLEGRWQPVDPLRLSLKAVGYLRDLVVDLSETEARRVVAPTRVRGGYVTLAPRLMLPGHFRFEPLVVAKRSDYRDYAGDYDETKAGGRLEWRRTDALVLSAGWFDLRRRYSQRNEYTAGGRALAGTQLRFRQREGELKVRSTFKGRDGAEWTAALGAGRLENRDGASGYFDYNQQRARLELGWRRAPWRVNLEGEARRLDYLNQTVGAGLAPPARLHDDHDLLLRVEREFNPRWTLFLEHRWERSRSNEVEFSYRANTALAGVQRAF